MKEQYKGERTIVKLTREDIEMLSNGKILNGYKVDLGIEIDLK